MVVSKYPKFHSIYLLGVFAILFGTFYSWELFLFYKIPPTPLNHFHSWILISPSSESVYSNKLLIPVNSERGGGGGGAGGRGGARRSPESRESAPQNREAPQSHRYANCIQS